MAITAKNILTKYLGYIAYTYIALGIISSIVSAHYSASLGTPFADSISETIANTLKGNFHNNTLFLVAWFLFAYAWVTAAGYALIKTLCLLPKHWCIGLSTLIGLLLCYIGMEYFAPVYRHAMKPENQWINLSCQVIVGTGFYLLGWSARLFNIKFNSLYAFIVLTAIILALRENSLVTSLVMAWSHYPSGFYVATFIAISGIYSCFFLATIASKGIAPLRLMRKIGDESKVIMSYHLLSLIATDYAFYLIGKFNFVGVSSSHHYVFPGSMPIYVAIGVLAPIAAKALITRVIHRLMPNRNISTITH